MELGWQIFSALVVLVFFAGATWWETRRTRRDVDAILRRIEPLPAFKVKLEDHDGWLQGHETRLQAIESRR